MSQEHMWESMIYILPLFTGVAQVCEQWDGQLGWEFSTAVKTARPLAAPSSLAQRSHGVASGSRSIGGTARQQREENKVFNHMTSSPTRSFFLSLKLGGIGIMWVLSNKK